jgi:hypothetical protein
MYLVEYEGSKHTS